MNFRSLTFCLLFLVFHLLAFSQIGENKFRQQEYSSFVNSNIRSNTEALHPLMDQYDIKHYLFDLEAGNSSAYLNGSVDIGFESLVESIDTFIFELVAYYTIDSIWLSGSNAKHIRSGDFVKVIVENEILQNSITNCQIFYHGELPTDLQKDVYGISHSEQYACTYTLSEPYFAKYWFPCKQDLRDKADSVFISITTDSGLVVASNGLLYNKQVLDDQKVKYEWRTRYPTEYYLIAINIAEYIEYNFYVELPDRIDSLLVQNFLYDSSSLQKNRDEIDRTSDLLVAFSDLFGTYPFVEEKYGHVMVPFPGGMEHQTLTSMGYFNEELIAHELAHHWYGNFITCATWQDIWINEGFATYSPFLALEYMHGEFPKDMMAGYINELMSGASYGSTYIPTSTFEIDYSDFDQLRNLSSRIFNWYLSYNKGAVILHMLRHELNNDAIFFQILKTFVLEYKHGTATGADFQKLLEDESGRDFNYFFNQWYFGEGYPRYFIQWRQEGKLLTIESLQSTNNSTTDFFRMTVDYHIQFEDGDTLIRLEQTSASQIFEVPVGKTVLAIKVDPNHNSLLDVEVSENIGFEPASLHFTSNLDLDVFPNPFINELRISKPAEDKLFLCLRDVTGKKVYSHITYAQGETLELGNLADGIYFLEIRSGSKREIFKLVKTGN